MVYLAIIAGVGGLWVLVSLLGWWRHQLELEHQRIIYAPPSDTLLSRKRRKRAGRQM